MDALSQLVRLVRLQASLDLRCQFADGVTVDHAGSVLREIEFHLVLVGRCVIETRDGESLQMVSGDFVALRRGTPHRVRAAGSADAAHSLVTSRQGLLTVRRSEIGDVSLDLLCGRFKVDSTTFDRLIEAIPSILHVSLSESTADTDLRVIVEMIRSEVDAGAAGAVAIVEALCTVLLTLALRIHSRRATVSPSLLRLIGDTRLAPAIQAILSDPGRDWTLDHLAALSAMSRATFARRFGEASAMTPGTLLLQVRMSRAADLLIRSQRSVADIGSDMGYQSEAAFSKAFKRLMEMSPARFRRAGRPSVEADLDSSDPIEQGMQTPGPVCVPHRP
jgi:AraC family transcriptional activator of mtrCDE